MDLHGDARWVTGDIDVVRADVELLDESGAAFKDGADDWSLPFADAGNPGAMSFGEFELGRERPLAAAPGGLGSPDLTHDGSGVALDLLPLQVLGIGAAANWHTSVGEASKQDDAIIPAFIGQLLEASAGLVAFDKVIEVRDLDPVVVGHVYDLQSEDGWILANGIVSSNCRCIDIIFTRRPEDIVKGV